MDTLKTLALAALAAVAVVGLVMWAQPNDSVGGVPGVSLWPTSVTTFTQGGGITATTTVGSVTLVSTDFDTENVVEINNTTVAPTITLPATSTMTNIAPNAGDVRTIWLRNASTSANSAFTVAAGAGMTFKNSASSSVNVIGDTDADNTLRVDFLRKSDGDINVYLSRYQD